MDTIAHGLWAAGIGRFGRLKTPWWLLGLMSMGPDFVWLPLTIWSLITTGHATFSMGLYNISHSLVVWGALTLLASIRWRRAIAVTWPWAFHIAIDIVGHTDVYTPILWPISQHKIPGQWNWLSLRWMIANYAALFVAGIFLFGRERRKKHKKIF